MSDLKTQIRGFVVKQFLFGQDDGFANTASFLESSILDSTGVLELVAHLESTYGITTADDELIPENLDSIEAVAGFVERKRGAVS